MMNSKVIEGNIYLTGLMGSGKSTCGQLLAEKMGWQFLDLDHEIEKAANMSVSEIFRTQGEPGFRILENRSLKQSAQLTHAVIACGGGAVTQTENVDFLKNEVTIWLDISPETAAKRLAYSDNRPLLSECEDTLKELEDILTRRRDAYEKSARIRINADQELAENVVENIVNALKDIHV